MFGLAASLREDATNRWMETIREAPRITTGHLDRPFPIRECRSYFVKLNSAECDPPSPSIMVTVLQDLA
jgi:hypothetical protein